MELADVVPPLGRAAIDLDEIAKLVRSEDQTALCIAVVLALASNCLQRRLDRVAVPMRRATVCLDDILHVCEGSGALVESNPVALAQGKRERVGERMMLSVGLHRFVPVLVLVLGCNAKVDGADTEPTCAWSLDLAGTCCDGAEACGSEYKCTRGNVTRDCWACRDARWEPVANNDCRDPEAGILDAVADVSVPDDVADGDACVSTPSEDGGCCEGARHCGPSYTCPCGITTRDCAVCQWGRWSHEVNDTCFFGCRDDGPPPDTASDIP
jgi:hypothetical protein